MIYRLQTGIDRQWKKKGTFLTGTLVALAVPAVTAFALIDRPESGQGTFGVNGITVTRGPIGDEEKQRTDDTDNQASGGEAQPTVHRSEENSSVAASSSAGSTPSTSQSDNDTEQPARGGEGPNGGTAPSNEEECLCESLPSAPTTEPQSEPSDQGTLENLLAIPSNTLNETTDALGNL